MRQPSSLDATVQALLGQVSLVVRASFLALLAIWVGGCQIAPYAITDSVGRDTSPIYRLAPGDKIRVTVYDREPLSGSFEIDSAGRVSLPLLQGVQAAGLSLPELERDISKGLEAEQFLDPKVSIDLLETRPVCVLGEVNRPGCFEYIYGMRAAAVIASAAGYTYRAKKDGLVILRADGSRVVTTHGALVFPGDVIDIGERIF